MSYKTGDKLVLTLGEKFVGDKGNVLFRVDGFNSLVFDKSGLDKLQNYNDFHREYIKYVRNEAMREGRREGWDRGYEYGYKDRKFELEMQPIITNADKFKEVFGVGLDEIESALDWATWFGAEYKEPEE